MLVRLLLDSDALIKLYRAGVLAVAAKACSCAVPEAVYDEAITQGKARLYPDAEAIERTVQESIEVRPASSHIGEGMIEAEARLGHGERALLSLYDGEEGGTIVSDDRYFLGFLARRGIPFLTPAALIVLFARDSTLRSEDTRAALEQLRPWIRESVYRQAIHDLQENREEEP